MAQNTTLDNWSFEPLLQSLDSATGASNPVATPAELADLIQFRRDLLRPPRLHFGIMPGKSDAIVRVRFERFTSSSSVALRPVLINRAVPLEARHLPAVFDIFNRGKWIRANISQADDGCIIHDLEHDELFSTGHIGPFYVNLDPSDMQIDLSVPTLQLRPSDTWLYDTVCRSLSTAEAIYLFDIRFGPVRTVAQMVIQYSTPQGRHFFNLDDVVRTIHQQT